MKLLKLLVNLFFFLLLSSCFMLHASCFLFQAFAQTTEIDAVKKYEEIIDLNNIDQITGLLEKERLKPKDEILLLLPKLEDPLYKGWAALGEPVIWVVGDEPPNFVSFDAGLLQDFNVEKILKQSYVKDSHGVDILIYKFKDFVFAYSAYTVLHKGGPTKLKVGKNACEAQNLINFWKGNYFVDIRSVVVDDSLAKEFVVLTSQDISKNITFDQLPPVVAIQLPALNRVNGSERYCLSVTCCNKFINLPDFNPNLFNLSDTGGIIVADYEPQENPVKKEREILTLLLTRYQSKESAVSTFNSLREIYELRKKENKDTEIDLDLDNGIVEVKNKKKDFTLFKQKGNMLAVVYNSSSKKSGGKLLELVPWPIEITKPLTGDK